MLKHGWYVEFLDTASWKEPMDGIRTPIEADMQDQASGLADHEMHIADARLDATCPGRWLHDHHVTCKRLAMSSAIMLL